MALASDPSRITAIACGKAFGTNESSRNVSPFNLSAPRSRRPNPSQPNESGWFIELRSDERRNGKDADAGDQGQENTEPNRSDQDRGKCAQLAYSEGLAHGHDLRRERPEPHDASDDEPEHGNGRQDQQES